MITLLNYGHNYNCISIMTSDTFLATMGGNNINIQFKGSVKNLELHLDSTLSMPGFDPTTS